MQCSSLFPAASPTVYEKKKIQVKPFPASTNNISVIDRTHFLYIFFNLVAFEQMVIQVLSTNSEILPYGPAPPCRQQSRHPMFPDEPCPDNLSHLLTKQVLSGTHADIARGAMC
jgi:hypothetical protein